MGQSRAKQFEVKFKKNWESTVPNSLCYRLYDTMGGMKGVCNAGDYICYKFPECYIIDCKSTNGGTFSVNFRQYDEMAKYEGIKGLHCGVVIWFCEKDKVVWVPFETFKQLRADEKKSYNIKMLEDKTYYSLEIPSKKLRTFLDSDYSILFGGNYDNN